MTKQEKLQQRHATVYVGLFAVTCMHYFSPELKEFVTLVVGLYWASDPSHLD